jgi:gluconate 2-dehydrogenase gamma chain
MILTACQRANRARLSAADFTTLNLEEVNELAAIAARIIPSDGTPGASEAGVIYFMDAVLGDNREEQLAMLRVGMREMQTEVALDFGAAYFHLLDPMQQDQILSKIDSTAFFSTVRFLTICGMFSLPEYGGNRDGVGYELIGFDARHSWEPPFGYYDADYLEKGE